MPPDIEFHIHKQLVMGEGKLDLVFFWVFSYNWTTMCNQPNRIENELASKIEILHVDIIGISG